MKTEYTSPRIAVFEAGAQSVLCSSPTESLNPKTGTWGSQYVLGGSNGDNCEN